MPDFQITWIDYTIVALYLVIVLAVGLWFARGNENAEDYFLAGRNFIWPLVGFSLLATNHSGASYIGVVQCWLRAGYSGLQLRDGGCVVPHLLPVFLSAFLLS